MKQEEFAALVRERSGYPMTQNRVSDLLEKPRKRGYRLEELRALAKTFRVSLVWFVFDIGARELPEVKEGRRGQTVTSPGQQRKRGSGG